MSRDVSPDRSVRFWEHSSDSEPLVIGLENDRMRVGLLPGKGGDVVELTHRGSGVDVLWRSPWGLPEPGLRTDAPPDSETGWLEAYPGGWQTIFPNGGPSCSYRGVELGFHGEASLRVWSWEIVDEDVPELRLATRLRRSPFDLERIVRLHPERPVLTVRERIRNRGGVRMAYVWGHHPALGAPFLDGHCRLDVGARTLVADACYESPHSPLAPGDTIAWPGPPDGVDLSQVPGSDRSRDLFAYFREFESGWYAVTNPRLGFGVGMRWPVETFPCAWFWQEMCATETFPWYGDAYVMALEPFTSYPGQGLRTVMEETGTERYLDPGEQVEAEIEVVFYEDLERVARIEPGGEVIPVDSD